MAVSNLSSLVTDPPSSLAAPSSPPSISPEKEEMLQKVIAHFSDDAYRLNGMAGRDEGKLDDWEMMFLSREGILRFLTATKFDLRAALTRLDKCMAWRRGFGVYDLAEMAKITEPESHCGKQFVIGFSNKSLPVLHMLPNRSDTETSQRQMKHSVYMLERVQDLFPPGVQNLCLVIDFAGKSQAPTSPGMAKAFISVLQDYYPERLGHAVLLSVPWLVKKFLDFAFTFVDPITKAKVSWNIVLSPALIPEVAALKEYGGHIEFTYTQEEYWPLLLKVCQERREAWRKEWRKMGGGVGQSEWDFKRAAAGVAINVDAMERQSMSEQVDKTSTSAGEDVENPTNLPDIPVRPSTERSSTQFFTPPATPRTIQPTTVNAPGMTQAEIMPSESLGSEGGRSDEGTVVGDEDKPVAGEGHESGGVSKAEEVPLEAPVERLSI